MLRFCKIRASPTAAAVVGRRKTRIRLCTVTIPRIADRNVVVGVPINNGEVPATTIPANTHTQRAVTIYFALNGAVASLTIRIAIVIARNIQGTIQIPRLIAGPGAAALATSGLA